MLDEATSALDVETEARVKQAIDRLRKDRTTFIIAHRLSTVRDADLVVFLDNGRVVEMGSFGELSARNGRFAALLRAGGLLTDEEVRRVSHIAIEDRRLRRRLSGTAPALGPTKGPLRCGHLPATLLGPIAVENRRSM